MALSAADKSFIQLVIKPIEQDICGIKVHLEKMNGKVSKHSDIINSAIEERAVNREHQRHFEEKMSPIPGKVEELEDKIKENSATKKFVIKAITFSFGFIGAIYGIIKIIDHFVQ